MVMLSSFRGDKHEFYLVVIKLIVIEVGRLWRCLVLLEVTSMSSILLSLSLSMFAVAKALTSHIHDCIE